MSICQRIQSHQITSKVQDDAIAWPGEVTAKTNKTCLDLHPAPTTEHEPADRDHGLVGYGIDTVLNSVEGIPVTDKTQG